MKYSLLKIALVLVSILSSSIYSQSIAVSIGSSNYYIAKTPNYLSSDIPLKDILLGYNFNIANNFQLSITSGYDWNSYNYYETQPGGEFSYITEYEVKSTGFPIEIGCKYQHYITSDSVFESAVGIGIGYCDIRSTIKNNNSIQNESDLTTKGFSQFITIGLNVHISKQITSFVELKKLILNNIKVTGSISSLGYPSTSTFTEDYLPSTELQDVGITLGVAYNL